MDSRCWCKNLGSSLERITQVDREVDIGIPDPTAHEDGHRCHSPHLLLLEQDRRHTPTLANSCCMDTPRFDREVERAATRADGTASRCDHHHHLLPYCLLHCLLHSPLSFVVLYPLLYPLLYSLLCPLLCPLLYLLLSSVLSSVLFYLLFYHLLCPLLCPFSVPFSGLCALLCP